jgi:peroxiredoxin
MPLQHLIGRPLPAAALPSTVGGSVDPARLPGRAVLFFYPYSGRPGVPDPPGWDTIPGAHGSTPQAQAYSRLYHEFLNRDVKLFGISLQDREWQLEFATRLGLAYPLLSDREQHLSAALGLPVFQAGEGTYLSRLTLIVGEARIAALRYPIADPEADAAAVLALL